MLVNVISSNIYYFTINLFTKTKIQTTASSRYSHCEFHENLYGKINQEIYIFANQFF